MAAALLGALFVSVAPAQAATFTVTNLDDSGPGSLRQAILDANTSPGADTITFSVTGTIVVSEGVLEVTDDLTISGPGAGNLTISGLGESLNVFRPLVNVEDPDTTLAVTGLTIANTANGIGPGGIRNFGTLNVSHAAFVDTVGTGGAGIGNEGTGRLTVSSSTFTSNGEPSIANRFGALGTVADSTFMDNFANQGGAIQNFGATLTVTDSTFSGNTAFSTGGAIANLPFGDLTVINSTFVGNTASGSSFGTLGGAIYSFGSLTVTNSTFDGNSADAGGGIITQFGSPVLNNTIVANSTSGGNCSGDFTDGGGNLSWPDTSCPGLNEDPLFDPAGLADNGGPTHTIALLPESPAIDVAIAANCPATDQRGVTRPQGPGCDIGAFEAPPSSPEALVNVVLTEIESRIGGENAPLSDKAEDVRDKLLAALAEFGKTPLDGAAALGNLEGAVGDLEAMVKDGLLDATQGRALMDTLASAGQVAARQAIDAAEGGDGAKLAEAEQALAAGEALQDADRFKEALSKYKEAYSKAASA